MPQSSLEASRQAAYQRIYATVDAIPRGRVATYGGVALAAGLPGRARMVGKALALLPAASRLPWHRVVRADGAIAERGDSRSQRTQSQRLRAEGIRFGRGGRVLLGAQLWEEAASAVSAARRPR